MRKKALTLNRETIRRMSPDWLYQVRGGDPEPERDPIVGSYQPSACVYGVGGCSGASAVASQGGACAGGTAACV